MTYENDPLEMGLERLVDWGLSDDASISMRALRAIKEQGVRRRINGVELDGDPFPELNNLKWPHRGRGRGRSAGSPPRSTRRDWSATSGSRGCRSSARRSASASPSRPSGVRARRTVVEMPFVDPGKQIPVS